MDEISHLSNLCQRADLLVRIGRLTETRLLLREALAIDPRSVYVLTQLALLEYSLRDFDQAMAVAELLIEAAPNAHAGFCVQAAICLEQRNWRAAARSAIRAIRSRPGGGGGYFMLGVALKNLGKLLPAGEAAAIATSIDPDSPENHLLMASVRLKARDSSAARASALAALELRADYGCAVLMLARVHAVEGDKRAAASAVRRARRLDPELDFHCVHCG